MLHVESFMPKTIEFFQANNWLCADEKNPSNGNKERKSGKSWTNWLKREIVIGINEFFVSNRRGREINALSFISHKSHTHHHEMSTHIFFLWMKHAPRMFWHSEIKSSERKRQRKCYKYFLPEISSTKDVSNNSGHPVDRSLMPSTWLDSFIVIYYAQRLQFVRVY